LGFFFRFQSISSLFFFRLILFSFFSGNQPVDLDASCVIVDGFANILDAAYFNQLLAMNGSVVHSGDNKTGEGGLFCFPTFSGLTSLQNLETMKESQFVWTCWNPT